MLQRLLLILFITPLLNYGQYTISGTFTPTDEYEWVLLYKVNPKGSNYVTKATLDSLGHFSIDLDSTNTKGMYKVVYNVPQEQFNFDFIYDAEEHVAFNFNTETGLEYSESSENKLLNSYTKTMSLVSQSIGNFYQQQSTDSTALEAIFKTLKKTQDEYEKLAEGKLVKVFIEANKPYMPSSYEDSETYVRNIKKHYFDHVDFDNELLQSSSFLIERALNYVFGMGGNEKGMSDVDIYKQNFIETTEAMKEANPEIKKMIYHIIWQQLADANYEELANFISDSYLLSLANQLGQQELVAELEQYKRLSSGMVAPDFELTLSKPEGDFETTLSALDSSTYYILIFWSSTCSHCLDELPQVHKLFKDVPREDVQVIAFGLEEEDYRWQSTIYDFPDFIHVLGLGKWENEVGNLYGVTGTPSYFILDKDKKIRAKPQTFEELVTVFQ